MDNFIRIIQLVWVRHLRDRYNANLSKLEMNRREIIKKKEFVEDKIKGLCNHNWQRDIEAKNERTTYICLNCYSYK